MRRIIIMMFLVGVLPLTSACRGGLCATKTEGLDDVDSDCIADEADNCILDYNPQQFDGDEDNVGFDCDSDDQDANVASISAELPDGLGDDADLDALPDFAGDYTAIAASCETHDTTLQILQDGTNLTLTGDVNAVYGATIGSLADGSFAYEALLIDGSALYGILADANTLKVLHMSGTELCSVVYQGTVEK